ncbi:MAG: ABC transporter permease [Rikenellaceae bacterium]|nr:ABC transporter permease [Rikenellaceae bacterium]
MLKLPFFFAKRYLFSRKSVSAINIITGISAFTVAIPVMAMVVLLSVFNGFDGLIKLMYKNFDPELRVTVSEGRIFSSDSISDIIKNTDDVESVSFVLDGNALFEYRKNQFIGTVRGVDEAYSQVVPIENMVVRGEYAPKFGDLDQVLVGQGIAYTLQMGGSMIEPLNIYVPKKGKTFSFLPVDFYRKKSIHPSGIYALDNETDGRYVIAPLDFARSLMDIGGGEVSAAFLKLKDGSDANKVRKVLSERLGNRFVVQTRYQQKESFYRIMQYEKWGIYFIILMVLVIASFSVIGSLTMIIIDKKRDTDALVTLGANRKLIRNIFVTEGMLISGTGMVAGLILGAALCMLQQKFGFIGMAGATFLVDAYPVQMKLTDIAGIVASVFVINYLISVFTVRSLIKEKYIA